MSDTQENDVISDFQAFPHSGEAPLTVALYATVKPDTGKVIQRLWILEDGDEKKSLNSAITIHTYQTPKVYQKEKLEIHLLSHGGELGGTREFSIEAKEPSTEHNAIVEVRRDNKPGYEYVNEKTYFEIILKEGEPSSRFEKVWWQFGDEENEDQWEDTNRTFKHTHVYKNPGGYTGYVKIKKRLEEIYYTKSFTVLIIPYRF